jgi:ubiquinone/menaquinone biosynthesis C-methylase UbiE
MTVNPNRSIYSENYVPEQLEIAAKTAYDSCVLKLRFRLLNEHCSGKNVLDLCCGSGAYIDHISDRVKMIVGLDFSHKMLVTGASRIQVATFVEADATQLPFADESFDTVFSIASLYYVPNVQRAVAETARVLRPGGVALLDLGNSLSLAAIVGKLCHKFYGWAKLYPIRYEKMLEAISNAQLAIDEHYVFQILPLFGPRLIQVLLPFSTSLFKYPLGVTINGRMLDCIISGAPLLRHVAFRHLFVLRKKQNG